jgi:lysozyme family protein
MADFSLAIGYVLANEGGLEINGADPGGTTNFGLAQADNPGVDIATLTQAQAEAIYQQKYWIFSGITNQQVATKVFDAWVNSEAHAINALQRSVGVTVDGVYGPATETAVNAANPETLLAEFCAQLAYNAALTAVSNSSQVQFLLGWLRRAVKLPPA